MVVCGTVVPVNALGPSWDWNAFIAWLTMIVRQQQTVPTSSSGTSIVPTTMTPTTSPPTTTAPTAPAVVAPVPTAAPTTTRAPSTTTTTRPASGNGSTSPVSGACINGPNPPANHYLRANVAGLPVLDNQWVNSLSATGETLKVLSEPRFLGYPVNLIPNNYSMSSIRMQVWDYISDNIPFPTPQFLKFQGWPGGPQYDHYQLSVTSDCRTYELIGLANFPFGIFDGTVPGPWKAEGGLMWDASYTPRANSMGGPMGVTAAAVPLTPQVLRAAEVNAGSVDHTLHFSSSVCRGGLAQPGVAYVWPARAADCVSTTPDDAKPPYGAWFRLRADYPMPTDPGARAVITALKTHGMILGDGPTQGIASEPGIPQAARAAIESVPLSSFEAVDSQQLRVDPAAGVASPDYWTTR